MVLVALCGIAMLVLPCRHCFVGIAMLVLVLPVWCPFSSVVCKIYIVALYITVALYTGFDNLNINYFTFFVYRVRHKLNNSFSLGPSFRRIHPPSNGSLNKSLDSSCYIGISIFI